MDVERVSLGSSDQYSARQIAAMFGLGTTTVTNWTKRPHDPLPSQNKGRRTLIRRSDVVEFIAANPDLPAASRVRTRFVEQADSEANAETSSQSRNLAEVARTAQAAAKDATHAALTAAQREKDSATKHLQIVERLVAVIGKLDDALTMALDGRGSRPMA